MSQLAQAAAGQVVVFLYSDSNLEVLPAPLPTDLATTQHLADQTAALGPRAQLQELGSQVGVGVGVGEIQGALGVSGALVAVMVRAGVGEVDHPLVSIVALAALEQTEQS